MYIYAVVFESNPNELVNNESVFADEGDAQKARDNWNAYIPACETRPAKVAPMVVSGAKTCFDGFLELIARKNFFNRSLNWVTVA